MKRKSSERCSAKDAIRIAVKISSYILHNWVKVIVFLQLFFFISLFSLWLAVHLYKAISSLLRVYYF